MTCKVKKFYFAQSLNLVQGPNQSFFINLPAYWSNNGKHLFLDRFSCFHLFHAGA
jgi:hypothetical protein